MSTSSFNSLGAFANYMRRQAITQCKHAMTSALDQIGQDVKAQAIANIGHYQNAVGNYPAWAQLAPATLDRKSRYGQGLGGNPDTPLYATGKLQRSIKYVVHRPSLSVHIGSNVKSIVYTEFGTQDMPPRPLFGPAAMQVMPRFLPMLGAYALAGIGGVSIATTRKSGISSYPISGFTI
ncbi:MAG: hypothetical protein K2W95_15735 [Candidatus Obscuribacterales bacterium]|nr:hypothetical protein [Candidatus Obscuribacterales bacterium]